MMAPPGTGHAEAPGWSALHQQASEGDRLALQVLLRLAIRSRDPSGGEPSWLTARGPSGRTLQHAAWQFGWMIELGELESRVGATPDLSDGVQAPRHLLDPDRPGDAAQASSTAERFHREAGGGLRFALRDQLVPAADPGPEQDVLRSVSAGDAGVPSGRTALHHAMRFGWIAEVLQLLDAPHNMKLDQTDKQGIRPWQLAVANGHGDILHQLREKHPALCTDFPAERVEHLSRALVLEDAQLVGRTPDQFHLPSVEDRAAWVSSGSVDEPPRLRVLPREAYAGGDLDGRGAGAHVGSSARRATVFAGSAPLPLPAPATAAPRPVAPARPGGSGRFSASSQGPKPAAPTGGPSPSAARPGGLSPSAARPGGLSPG